MVFYCDLHMELFVAGCERIPGVTSDYMTHINSCMGGIVKITFICMCECQDVNLSLVFVYFNVRGM